MKQVILMVILGILSGTGSHLVSAAVKNNKRDTLVVSSVKDRHWRDSVLKVSVVYLPDSLIRDTLRYEYIKIKKAAYKSALTKELYKLIFVNPKPNRVNVMRAQNSEDRFRPFAGKRIRQIQVKVLPPYGTSVYDTTYSEQDLGWLRTAANKIHMRTADWVVRKQLTLKPGERLIPFELVQNEILLRHLAYIEDASIMVSEVPGDPSEVDLTVVCKDDFSWGAEISSNFLNSARIAVANKNFMKIGHQVEYEISYRGTKEQKWGNIVEYNINSAFGTHFNVTGYYQNDYLAKQLWGTIEREFLTSTVKWAGGITLSRVFRSRDLPDLNLRHLKRRFNYNSQDIWIGRSFLLDSRHRYTRNIYVTTRFLNTIFKNRPDVTSDTNQFYYNRHSYYSSLVFQKLKYYKANLIYDFGRTEDIPIGLSSALIVGYENNEFRNSTYLGYNVRYAHFNNHTERYYAADMALGSYVNGSGFERGVLRMGFHHISNLLSLGIYRFRFYNDVNYVTGFRRYPDDYLYLRDVDILGFDSDTLRGAQKLSTSLSTTVFFPFIKKGFRMSLTGFLDVGTLVPKETSVFRGKAYWGMGIAVNLRNDNIVFKNISLRLSY